MKKIYFHCTYVEFHLFAFYAKLFKIRLFCNIRHLSFLISVPGSIAGSIFSEETSNNEDSPKTFVRVTAAAKEVSPSHAALRRSIKWNRVCIFAWISFFCVCSNADQGKSIFSFPQFVVGLMSIARSTSLVLDNVLVFQSFAISLKPAR